MKRVARFVIAVAILWTIGVGAVSLWTVPARAADNPCDPTYRMLSDCRAQHGHWDNSCCCCKSH